MAPRKCFYGCEGKVRLFSFPKEASTRQKWEELLFSGQKQRRTYVFVCQRHFTRDCFLNVGAYDAGLSVRLLLKDEALPTILARVEESAEQSPQVLRDPQHRHTGSQPVPTESRAVQFSPYMVSVGTNMARCPFTKCVATQLSYSTLKAKVRSRGTQTEQLDKGLQYSPPPSRGFTSTKRARLECEESEDDDEEEGTSVPHENI